MSGIPLVRAYLCLDDDTVFDGGELLRACPSCGGRFVWPLARFLTREVLKAREVRHA